MEYFACIEKLEILIHPFSGQFLFYSGSPIGMTIYQSEVAILENGGLVVLTNAWLLTEMAAKPINRYYFKKVRQLLISTAN